VTTLSASRADLRRAADAIRAGLLVAFPTETVYGLGADAFNQTALARVFAAKDRPRFDPLIVHIAAVEMLDRLADLSALPPLLRDMAAALSERFWPGPLTLALPKRPLVPDLATGGLPTVAIRFPDHPVARELIRLSTGAVAAPSANRFGSLSPTSADHVREQLGDRIDFLFDGGRTAVGVESTVLDLSGGAGNSGAAARPRLLRPGGVSREAIEALIGAVEVPEPEDGSPVSPGQLKSHYAPRTPLSLHGSEAMAELRHRQGELHLFFSGTARDSWLAEQAGTDAPRDAAWTLSRAGDTLEAAASLFDLLHRLDRLGASRIHAEEAPAHGLGPAINDRLFRAAGSKKTGKHA
jgi:L-threonylcarbamoyladenylate synthase